MNAGAHSRRSSLRVIVKSVHDCDFQVSVFTPFSDSLIEKFPPLGHNFVVSSSLRFVVATEVERWSNRLGDLLFGGTNV